MDAVQTLEVVAAQLNALIRLKESQRRYRQSEKGREAVRRAQQKYALKNRTGRPVGRPKKSI